MADVGSLGQYKVVVTADYSQLQSQFKAMTTFINDSTKQITESLNKSMGAINATMIAQLQTSVNSLKRAFDGLDDTTKKGGDGFKSYASQIRKAEKAAQKCHQEITSLQEKMATSSVTDSKDIARLDQLKAQFRDIRQQTDQLKAAQADYNMRIKETANLEAMAAKAKKQADQEGLKALREQAKARQDEQSRQARQDQALAAQRQRDIRRLTTQYKVAYEEINKYMQAHAKMSEAVFIRLQGRITSFGNQIRELGAVPPIANPLEGLNYEQYVSGFSKLNDVLKSVRHHLMWMASAAIIGAGFGIPMGVSKAIESFDALQTKILQNIELANQYAGDTNKLHSAVNQMGEAAKVYAQGFGVSLAEVQDVIQVLTRRYKDADTAIYLTGIALKMSVLDMIDTKLAAKDLEAVLLQFGMGAKDAGQFLNDFSVICHDARISGTDMLMALERSGSAFAAAGMGAREAQAAIAAVATTTGKTGATIGDSWKSILANLDFKKAQQALDAYNIKLYETGKNGEKVQRQGAVVLTEILKQYAKLDDEGQKKLATAIAGGKYQVNNMQAFLRDSSQSFLTYIEDMKNKSSDATTEGLLEKAMNTYERKLNQAKASFEVFGVTIGNMVLPYLKDMAILMTAAGNVAQKNAGKILGVVGVLGRLALAFIAVKTAMMIWAGASAIYTGIEAGITTVANAVKGLAIVEGALAVVTAVKNGLLLLAAPLTMAYAYAATASGVASTVASTGVGFLVGSLTLLKAILAPIGVATLATVAIIATLGVIAYEVYENWETVSNDLTYIWNELVDVIATAIEAIIIAITPFIAIAYALVQVVEWAIKEVIAPTFTLLGQKIKIAIDFCVGVLTWFWNKVKELAAWVVKGIQSIVPGVVGFVSGWASVFQQAIQPLVDFASNVVRIAEKVKNAIKSMLTLGKDSGSEGEGEGIIAKIKSWIGVNDPESEISKAMNAAKAAMELKAGSVDGITGGGAPHGFEPNAIPAGGGGGGSKGKGAKGAKGAKEADNSIEAVLYRFLTKEKGLSHNRAIGELANVQAVSGFNYQAGEGTDRYGLYGWDKSQQAKYQEWLKGTGYKDNAVSQINYQHTYAMRYDDEEKKKYRDFLRAGSSTPQEFAQAFSDSITKAGAIDTGIVEGFDKRFAKKNGEENLEDPMKALAERYKELKQEYDREINDLKTERAKKGQNVSAEEQRKLYEQMMGIGDGKNPFAYLDAAIKDYEKVLLEAAKYEAKRQEDIKKSTETQVKAIEKMADSEVAFAEKIGLINKADVHKYEYEKNERSYATKMPALSAKLGSTVDMSKGTADDMASLYKSLIHAQDAYEAEHYAKKIFSLSRDVDATQKALGEMLKLEQSYQDKRAKLEQDAFEYKNRYTLKFIDSLSSAIGSSLEGILNRTKTFAEAFRDIFKAVVNDIIKLFSEDFAQRIKKWLTNAIYKPKATGNPAGSYVDTDMYYGGKNGASLLGGGYGKSNPLLKAMGLTPNLAAQAKAMITPVTYTLRNSVKTTFDGLSNLTAQGMNTISAGVQTGTEAMSMTFGNYKVMQVQTNEIGDNAIIAKNQSTAATVQATSTAMMGWLMAILALFSLFGGHGGGSKTSTSTSSTNLGRAPETYYMTPTPVLQSTNYTVPSMDIGGNIERDMLIFAHKNEMVLTPEQADVIRSTAKSGGSIGGGSSANANIKSNVTVSTVDSRGFERVLKDYNRQLSKNVKKGIRNGYLNAKGLV